MDSSSIVDKVILENEAVRVTINNHGAELSSIWDKIKERELIWCADPEIWGRHAPVLFPTIGSCFKRELRAKGQVYTMLQHGFARDRNFTVLRQEKDLVVHRLSSDEDTLSRYPFPFVLTITHHLTRDGVEVFWEVDNTGSDTMYFQLGGHPAFNIPKGCVMTDAAIEFETDGPYTYGRIEAPGSGCAYPERYTLNLTDKQIDVGPDFWKEGVYIFGEGQVQRARLLYQKEPYVEVYADHVPYYGIWSKPTHPFICLEPWYGRCDDIGFTGDISQKEAVNSLEAGKTFKGGYGIRVLSQEAEA